MIKTFSPMMLNLILLMIIMFPLTFKKLHPLSLILMLIFYTLLISMSMSMMNNTWLCYIIFLSIIGGLLVVFLYMTSLMNNTSFKIKKLIKTNAVKNYKFMLILMIIFMLIYFITFKSLNFDDSLLNNYSMNLNYYLTFYYKKYYNLSTMFLMIYLYYTMIIIMEICFIYNAPLRQMKY